MRIKSRALAEEHGLRALLRGSRARWLLGAGYTVAILLAGAGLHRTGLLRQAIDLATPRSLTLLVRRAQGALARPERLTIDIAHKDFMNLAHQRDVALGRQVLIVSDEDVVNATVRWRGQVIPAKIRLKGDLVDHLQGEKWSFRVVARQDSTVLGMKQFSLQHPQTRFYLYEKLYHEAMRREGLVALRYEFLELTVNGKDLGVYALEEAFETRLIENNQRKDGPIVRFNEDILWGELARQVSVAPNERGAVAGAGSYTSSDIDAFQTAKWVATPGGRNQFLAAIGLLEGFRRGRLTVDEVFDSDMMARFFALSDLLRAWHGVGNWPNARFYYNSITGRLEPIAFDAYNREMPGKPGLLVLQAGDETRDPAARQYISQFFADTAFYRRYLAALERMSTPGYVDSLQADLGEQLAPSLRILHREFPDVELDWVPLRRSAEFIQTALHPPQALQAYLRAKDAGEVELEVANMQLLPLRIVGLARDSLAWPVAGLALPGKQVRDPLRFQPLTVRVPGDFTWPDTLDAPLLVRFQVLGSSRIDAAPVHPWPHDGPGESTLRREPPRRVPNMGAFPFLTVDQAGGRVGIREGSWRVDRTIVIPAGYRIYAGPGTRLDLVRGAGIYSGSPLEWIGSEAEPVVVQSSDGTGQGVVVHRAGDESHLQQVRFQGLTNAKVEGWELTGAVAFYESPVTMRRVHFLENHSEDALHVMRSTFTLDSVTFERTSSDAFDVDFGVGTVRHSRFLAPGNDGIDASGSVVTLEDVLIRDAGDKAVSAGEVATLLGRHLVLENAAIGIASKDRSTVRLSDVTIRGGQVGITAYLKKSEYGPAWIEIQGFAQRGTAVPFMIERHSSLVIDGRHLPADRLLVADSLYGAVYGKASVR